MSEFRPIRLGDLSVNVINIDPDTVLLNSKQKLDTYPTTIIDRLIYWAHEIPDHVFLAQRNATDTDGWEKLTYLQTLTAVKNIAAHLSQYSLSSQRPVAVLSGNSIAHALMGLATMYIGVPYAPISPQYSLVSNDYAKLKHVLQLITPGLIFAENLEFFNEAIQKSALQDSVIVSSSGGIDHFQCVQFSELVKHPGSGNIESLQSKIESKTIAKFLFSSGSTGMPKAVINTHGMLAANQQMIIQAYPFLKENPVLVDWLPWNHTFGGNHNLGMALYNGGSYFIDSGKPTTQGFKETIRNLEEISPTAYFNVPKGYDLLVPYLRENARLRKTFFKNLQMMFYAGAGISQPVWDALDELALQTCGQRIKILTGLGCTETSPSALFTTHQKGFAGLIGLPLPGIQTKLKRVNDKMEIRFRGDNVTPGYWRAPELSANAFDEDGFYKTGDAVKFVDNDDPLQGLQFDGRISEDFKLDTGTWVSTGPLRARFLDHFGPLVKDVVIIGIDKPVIGALVFPDYDYCRNYMQSSNENAECLKNNELLLSHPKLRNLFQQHLVRFSEKATGSSTRIDRFILELNPPSVERHEITDKGSLNSSVIQGHRSELIDALYENPMSVRAICLNVPEPSESIQINHKKPE